MALEVERTSNTYKAAYTSKFYARKENRGTVLSVARKRKSWARSVNFKVFAELPYIASRARMALDYLYFIYSRNIYVHTHVKLHESGNPPL